MTKILTTFHVARRVLINLLITVGNCQSGAVGAVGLRDGIQMSHNQQSLSLASGIQCIR